MNASAFSKLLSAEGSEAVHKRIDRCVKKRKLEMIKCHGAEEVVIRRKEEQKCYV